MKRSSAVALVAGFVLLGLASPGLAQKPKPSPSPKKETPSYTSDDLDRLAGRTPGEPAKPAPGTKTPQPEAPAKPADGALTYDPNVPDPPKSDENMSDADKAAAGGGWGDRAKALREAAAAAEEHVKDLDSQAQTLLWQYLQSTDTNEILQMKAAQQVILDEIPEARKAAEEANKALEAFLKEAAQAGVAPGELRPQKNP